MKPVTGLWLNPRLPPLRLVALGFLLVGPGLPAWLPAAQDRARAELTFPNPPGYQTLKCDFHAHTVFSDGAVWPTIRVEEAWRDGLDAIAISDHLEYQPHRSDVSTNYERSFELARAAAAPLDILVIRAAEITRGEPPGHMNALFLKAVTPLRREDYRDAVRAAVEQGGFVFWNHPGWKQPDRKSVWYAEQGELLAKGWLHGIEVINGAEYDPIAHQWCLDRKLAMLANSDVHGPIAWDYPAEERQHRPLTLVFAERRTLDAIREALLARRTVLYSQHTLYGEATWLQPLFHGALELRSGPVRLQGTTRGFAQVFNRSPVTFDLESLGRVPEVNVPKRVRLHAGKTSLIELTPRTNNLSGVRTLRLPFRATNLKTTPDQSLEVTLDVPVEFVR